jgi:hypothetical protein
MAACVKDSYLGPRDGKGDAAHVSRQWCGGVVVGCSRYVDYPMVTAYSREVQQRIIRWNPPAQRLVDVLRWRAA